MVQRSYLETNRFTATPEISCILWKRNLHCRGHNSQPLLGTVSQMNAIHSLMSYF